VDHVEVSTVVYLSPEAVYEFLLDFPRYSEYSKHLRAVTVDGDGGPGTDYRLQFAWWKLTYTAHTTVTDVDPPNRIEWEVVEDLQAAGWWSVEPVPAEAPTDQDVATRVTFRAEYRPDSVERGAIDLPGFVSLGWVVDKAEPIVRREAERVVERIVADLEGQRRPVELEISTS
jgi:uncharacterized membrane protein